VSTPASANHLFAELTDSQIKSLLPETVILLPIGSIEPHGHLPLATDSMIAHSILNRVAEKTKDAWVLPTIPLGYLFKYSQWPGSVGVASDTMSAIIFEVAASLAKDNLRRIFVMSGHDENREPTLQALRQAHISFKTLGVYCDWLDLGVSLVKQISSSRREGHASEIQTSVFQYLFPEFELVIPKVTTDVPLKMGDDDLFLETEGGTWVDSVPRDVSGSFSGDPSHATVEKGRLVLDHIVERAVSIVNELKTRDTR
jgi:creatinine amidohydrolase